ncbi:MAG TPA: hypothetical protein VGJ36_04370 [Gemmatimonadales bacterium]|jgi:hypothetical protein
MYRIELSPGEETVFRSIEELAVAIKRGVVNPRARIYHNASNKWLPIQFHPHYRVALSMPLTQAALVAGPPVKALSSLSLPQDADPEPPAPRPAPAARMATPAEPPAPRKKTRSEQPAREKRSRRNGKPHRELRIALIGALLVGGAQWVLSGPLFLRSDASALLVSHRRLIAAPANTAAMFPVISSPAAPTTPASFGGVPTARPAAAPAEPETMPPTVETGAAAEIEPAPSTIDVSAPAAPASDSLAAPVVDSSGKRAMKGILRTISGTPGKEKASAKR